MRGGLWSDVVSETGFTVVTISDNYGSCSRLHPPLFILDWYVLFISVLMWVGLEGDGREWGGRDVILKTQTSIIIIKIGPLVLGSFGFHEIRRISWNPPDFMHEIRRISWNSADFMKSGRFHAWNSADFMHEIWQISWNLADFICKLPHFTYEIRRISWNSADFMKFGRFHMQIASFAYEIWRISWWNPADFIHEIRRILWLILKNANLKM